MDEEIKHEELKQDITDALSQVADEQPEIDIGAVIKHTPQLAMLVDHMRETWRLYGWYKMLITTQCTDMAMANAVLEHAMGAVTDERGQMKAFSPSVTLRSLRNEMLPFLESEMVKARKEVPETHVDQIEKVFDGFLNTKYAINTRTDNEPGVVIVSGDKLRPVLVEITKRLQDQMPVLYISGNDVWDEGQLKPPTYIRHEHSAHFIGNASLLRKISGISANYSTIVIEDAGDAIRKKAGKTLGKEDILEGVKKLRQWAKNMNTLIICGMTNSEAAHVLAQNEHKFSHMLAGSESGIVINGQLVV